MQNLSIILLLFLVSCQTSKPPKTHVWKDKSVTEKTDNKMVDKHTRDFVKNTPEEVLKLFLEMTIVYDTLPAQK